MSPHPPPPSPPSATAAATIPPGIAARALNTLLSSGSSCFDAERACCLACSGWCRPYITVADTVAGGMDLATETSGAVWCWVLTECRAPSPGPCHSGIAPDDLGFVGLSVHWLSTTLLHWVEEAGLDPATALVHAVEPAVIRPKSAGTVCPADNLPGAALVHAAEGGADTIGEATHMISYGWGYVIGDIVATLVEHCRSAKLDPKRTYIWICCMCINQHRVKESQAAGKVVLTEDFMGEFGPKVTRIGNVLAMMAPWNEPLYLTRIWCGEDPRHVPNCPPVLPGGLRWLTRSRD